MIRKRTSELIAKTILHLLLLSFALLCLAPMVLTLSVSFSDESDLISGGYRFIPKAVSLDAYAFIFKNPTALLSSYWVTIRITAFGTFLGVLFMSMAAFSLSRKDFTWRKPIVFYVFFTMLFSGGLVPLYMVVTRTLHLQDTLMVLFFPIMVNAWNTFLLVTYLRSISFEMIESAKLDGASEFTIYARVVMPMATPGLIPLQYWMQRVMNNMQFLLMNQDKMGGGSGIAMMDLPTESVRMAMAILAAGPMMFVFPFFQKYFAKGLLIGSVKG